jgi:hypothetical protein
MKKSIRFKSVYVPILLMICGCGNSKAPITLPSLQQIKSPLANKSNPSGSESLQSSKQNGHQKLAEVAKVAGSELPDQWVSSKDKTVNCRIKQWTSYPSGTNIKMEFMNISSNKPVNIVYTLFVGDDQGSAIPIFNPYRNEQFTITDFKPLLEKGQSSLVETEPKHVTAFSVKLKACRIATKSENYLTINPEMVDDGGP